MSLKKILVTNINQIEPKHVSPKEIYEFDRYDVSGLLHENKCTVTFYSLSPGKSNYPYHYHTQHKEKEKHKRRAGASKGATARPG